MMRTPLYEAAQVMLTRAELVLAEILGDEYRQARQPMQGYRCIGRASGRNPASDVEQWDRVPLGQRGCHGLCLIRREA